MRTLLGSRFLASRALLMGLLAFTSVTRAQPERSDTALAESLFQQGRQLMGEGNLEQACKSLEASLALERAVGTLLNLGRCYQRQGLLARSWSMFVAAENEALASGDQDRATLARKQHARLADRVPKVILQVEGSLDDADLTLDGQALSSTTLGLEIPLDPGIHRLAAKLPDGRTVERVFSCEQRSDRTKPALSVLLRLPAAAARPSTPLSSPTSDGGARQNPDRLSAPRERRARTESPNVGAGWLMPTLLAAGGAGVALSGGLGFSAVRKADRADCDENLACSPDGLEDREDAQRLLDISYGIGIGSGVILASGLVLWWWSPHESTRSAGVSVSTGVAQATPYGIELTARF